LLISVLQAGDVGWGQSLLLFFVQMGVGALSGYLLGKLAVFIINRIDIGNKSLYSVLLLAFVFFIFAFTDFINGNGFLAVYIAGLIVGNNKLIYKKSLASFFDGLTWLFQIIMFLTLGLLVNPHELLGVTLIGLIVGIFMILFARPISVLLCLAPFRQLSTRARLYVSWVGLRGAVPIIFATYPIVAQLEHARIIFNIVFFITILSLVIQGTTVSWVASLLGLSTETKERGFDIDLPDEVKAKLIEMEVTSTFMTEATLLRNVQLPPDVLVMMIRRGDEYLVPRGDTEIHLGDKLLFIRQEK
jgi:cell volume regulation protein A